MEASARILAASPLDELDTNHVAARAGVSIGSLYQYFPNKGAILAGLAERHLARKLLTLRAEFEASAALPLETRIERAIGWLISTKQAGAELERALYLHFHRYGDPSAIAALDGPLIDQLALVLGGADGDVRWRFRAFVLFQAVRGALLASALVHPGSLVDGTLRDELAALVRGYALHRHDRPDELRR